MALSEEAKRFEAFTAPALLEALEHARKRVDVLELEKSHALHRFEEQTATLRRVRAELKTLQDEKKP